jgi:hypothetical protein
MDKPDPISTVLGATAPGPFALLGLPAEDVTIQRVLGALHLRLEQVNASPHAATPAAEDVRLALHAAAAQLCDPAVRRLLLGTWSAASLGTVMDEPLADAALAIEADLHIAVGLSGGWNAAAMQRLALACESRGVGLDELGTVLATIGSKRPPEARCRARWLAHAASGIEPSRAVGSNPIPRELLLLLAGGVAVVVLLVVGIVMITGPRRGSATAREVVEVLEGGVREASPLVMEEKKPVTVAAPAPELSVGGARAIERELAALSEAVAQTTGEPAEIRERFESAYKSFTTDWHLLRRDEVTAILSAMIDLAFAASQRQRESELVPILMEPLRSVPRDRREVRSLVAAGATIARLMQERDLPRGMRQQLEAALRANVVTSGLGPVLRFETATEQIVLPLAAALAAGPSWQSTGVWRGFVDARDAALGDRARTKDAATLVALQGLMRQKADDADASGEDAVALVAGALTWTKSPELRSAVLGWIDDTAVPPARLATLMRAMIKSSMRGVDSTMTLAPTASAEQRQELRPLVEAALRDDSRGPGAEAVQAWATAADGLLAQKPTRPEQVVDLAARLSELVAARAAQIEGQDDIASTLIASAAGATALPAPGSTQELPSVRPNSRAIEYLALGPSQAARSEFWKKAAVQPIGLDLLLARTAIEEAARGSPATVRDAARDCVRARANDDAIVLAALELIFSIPESAKNMQWLGDVAGRKIAWRGKGASRESAHLAMLDAAAARFASRPDEAAINAAADRLSKAWLSRGGETRGADAVPPTEAARRLATRMLALQRDSRGAEVGARRRLEARLAITRGPVQECVWWQAVIVEMIAADVLKRSPATRVREAMEQWNTQRRRASSSYEQLLEGERAAVGLLRAEIESAPSTGGGA